MFRKISTDCGMNVSDFHACSKCKQTYFDYVECPDHYRRECLTPECERLFNGFIPKRILITVVGKFGR